MCFSATASFSAAGVTAILGIACLSRARRWRETTLASFPLLFAAQQAIEGFLWLRLGNGDNDAITALSVAFLLFAQVLWPMLAPIGVLLVEPDQRRRLAMKGLAALSVFVAAYLLYVMVKSPYEVSVIGGSLRYATDMRTPLPGGKVLYAASTVLPLLLSSHRPLAVMGGIVAVGLAVSLYAFQMTFISVWCFFAAAASTVLYFHFANTERPLL
ncbi:MAG: hypothetical protein DCC73_14810 [Proteobacteria bacterium]|nr:MAG: hypothetical protein DCC73_14810 [Pseudomonadota bacterium]